MYICMYVYVLCVYTLRMRPQRLHCQTIMPKQKQLPTECEREALIVTMLIFWKLLLVRHNREKKTFPELFKVWTFVFCVDWEIPTSLLFTAFATSMEPPLLLGWYKRRGDRGIIMNGVGPRRKLMIERCQRDDLTESFDSFLQICPQGW